MPLKSGKLSCHFLPCHKIGDTHHVWGSEVPDTSAQFHRYAPCVAADSTSWLSPRGNICCATIHCRKPRHWYLSSQLVSILNNLVPMWTCWVALLPSTSKYVAKQASRRFHPRAWLSRHAETFNRLLWGIASFSAECFFICPKSSQGVGKQPYNYATQEFFSSYNISLTVLRTLQYGPWFWSGMLSIIFFHVQFDLPEIFR